MSGNNKRASAPAWPAIRAAYEAGKQPVAEICTAFGITRQSLYKTARAENWPRRAAQKQPALKSANQPRQVKTLPAHKTLKDALEFITMDLMQRINQTKTTSDGFEKEARTLSSLVRTYEKLKAIEDGDLVKEQKQRRDQNEHDETANQRRRHLAARLEKLIKTL